VFGYLKDEAIYDAGNLISSTYIIYDGKDWILQLKDLIANGSQG
jgi:hypothetical protein